MSKPPSTRPLFWVAAVLLASLALLIGNSPRPAIPTAWAAPAVTVSFQQGAGGYTGTADTYIAQATPTTSRATTLWVEWDSDDPVGTGQSNFGLIRFDGIFGAGANQIPPGATILTATLTYVVSNVGVAGLMNEVAVNWAESVTYNTFGAAAGVQAGDYGASLGSLDGGSLGAKTKDVTSSLAAWSANPAANRGWIIRPGGTDGIEFRSSNYGTIAERPRLVVEYTSPGDDPPIAPTVVNPQDGATSASGPLTVNVVDPDGDDLNVTFYGRKVGDTEVGQDFTIIAMPDTQHYVDNAGANAAHFMAQTQWLEANADDLNIVFVTGLGDIVQNGNTADSEWQIADNAYSQIEDSTSPTYGIPYGLSVGNHDQQPIGGGSSASTSKYNEYFGVARFDGRVYYGGHHGSDNDNHYELFSAAGIDFINISFEYDTTPEQAVLDWADNLLTTHSDRQAIVSTHHLINLGNPASFGPQGQAIYNALSDHENLFLMLGGHVHGEGRRQDTGPNGNLIHSLLSDYQDYPNGGNGFLRIMTFSPANDTIQVRTYSPSLNQYETDDSSQFTLSYEMNGTGAFQVIGSVTVESGLDASVPALGLDQGGTEYEWYVRVDDGSHVTTGPTWSFTAGAPVPPPSPTFTATSPASPANDNSPEIRGSAASGTTVRLYTNNTCTSSVAATGSTTTFASPGLTVAVSDNTSTTLWATATNGASMTSACTPTSITYTEVTPPPPEAQLYLSLLDAVTLNGTSFAPQDVLAFNGSTFTYFFDGSDVGLSGTLDGFDIIAADKLLLSFAGSVSIPASRSATGVAFSADDSDILLFTGSFGPTTSGLFSLYFDGSVFGLTTDDEDVDALEVLPDGRLVVSTLGSASVTGVSAASQDLMVFNPANNSWAMYFDGSDVSLSSSDENLDALALDADGKLYLSTTANFSVTNRSGADEDVFVFTPTSLGGSTAGTFSATLFFDGSAFGLSAGDITGIDLPGGATPPDPGPPGDTTPPAAPSFTATSPASPANDNSPEIRGSAESGSTVRLYTNSACTSSVAATGSAATFASPGLTVTVSDNTTTTFWATATDAANNPSACSPASITYTEVTPAQPPSGVQLYLSLSSDATLSGTNFTSEDVLAFNGSAFSYFFDGSDVGLSESIDAFDIIAADRLLLSLSSSMSIPASRSSTGVAFEADDSDILLFTGSFGSTTSGLFSLYFDGSAFGLTSSDEDVDAVSLLPDGRLVMSTSGAASVTGVSAEEQDLLVFNPSNGSWAMYFDGSDVALSSSDEDIDALAIGGNGNIYLSTSGSFSVTNSSGADEDVFVFTPSSLGGNTAGTFSASLFLDGSAVGLGGNDITGIGLP